MDLLENKGMDNSEVDQNSLVLAQRILKTNDEVNSRLIAFGMVKEPCSEFKLEIGQNIEEVYKQHLEGLGCGYMSLKNKVDSNKYDHMFNH